MTVIAATRSQEAVQGMAGVGGISYLAKKIPDQSTRVTVSYHNHVIQRMSLLVL